jgi:hypothetical protein
VRFVGERGGDFDLVGLVGLVVVVEVGEEDGLDSVVLRVSRIRGRDAKRLWFWERGTTHREGGVNFRGWKVEPSLSVWCGLWW